MATDRSRSRSKPEDEPKPDPKPEAKAKPKDPLLVFNRRGGVYQCTHNHPRTKDGTPDGEPVMVGTGVQSMEVKSFRVFPGPNLVDPDLFDLVKDNLGLAHRLRAREIVISRKSWAEIDSGTCIEEAKKGANLRTLADLLEAEKREDVAQALEAALEVATRTVRKDKPHLTAIQIARAGGKI